MQNGFAEPLSKTQFLRAFVRGDNEKILSMPSEQVLALMHLKDKDGHTPLHLACIKQGSKDKNPLIELLIHHGADINAIRSDYITPLHIAVLTENLTAVNALSQHASLDPNNLDQNTYTPLLYAVCKKSTPLVTALLKLSKVNPNFGTCDGASPLHFAAMQGSIDIVKELLAHPSIDINARQDFSQYAGATPLHFAALQAFPDIVDMLLEQDDINIHLEVTSGIFKGFTPLHFAVMNPDISKVHRVVKSLLKKGANPKKNATSALKSPSELTQISIIQKLLKKKW